MMYTCFSNEFGLKSLSFIVNFVTAVTSVSARLPYQMGLMEHKVQKVLKATEEKKAIKVLMVCKDHQD